MSTSDNLNFYSLKKLRIIAQFNSGKISSNGGTSIILRELKADMGIFKRLAEGFTDFPDPSVARQSREAFNVAMSKTITVYLRIVNVGDTPKKTRKLS